MKSESKLVLDLWDHIGDLISPQKRTDAALHILRVLEDYGIEPSKIDLEGEDDYLDEALEMFFESDDEDEDVSSYYDDDDSDNY